jgi:hypothetical protein
MRRGLIARIGRLHQGKGILAPVAWDLAEPLLVEVKEKWGIEMVEKTLAKETVRDATKVVSNAFMKVHDHGCTSNDWNRQNVYL